MVRKVRMTKNGVVCRVNDTKIHLDPKNTMSVGINFVSHAHVDHLPYQNGGTIYPQKKQMQSQNYVGLRWKIMLII